MNIQPVLATPALLMNQLATLETTRRAYSPSVAPENQKFEILRWTDPALGVQAKVQLTFDSRINTNYQLQKSTYLIGWNNVGAVIAGNNGPVLMSDTFAGTKAFYRIQWTQVS